MVGAIVGAGVLELGYVVRWVCGVEVMYMNALATVRRCGGLDLGDVLGASATAAVCGGAARPVQSLPAPVAELRSVDGASYGKDRDAGTDGAFTGKGREVVGDVDQGSSTTGAACGWAALARSAVGCAEKSAGMGAVAKSLGHKVSKLAVVQA